MDELLTGKDLDTIARAHRHCREMEIERTLGALRERRHGSSRDLRA